MSCDKATERVPIDDKCLGDIATGRMALDDKFLGDKTTVTGAR